MFASQITECLQTELTRLNARGLIILGELKGNHPNYTIRVVFGGRSYICNAYDLATLLSTSKGYEEELLWAIKSSAPRKQRPMTNFP